MSPNPGWIVIENWGVFACLALLSAGALAGLFWLKLSNAKGNTSLEPWPEKNRRCWQGEDCSRGICSVARGSEALPSTTWALAAKCGQLWISPQPTNGLKPWQTKRPVDHLNLIRLDQPVCRGFHFGPISLKPPLQKPVGRSRQQLAPNCFQRLQVLCGQA